MTRVHLRVVLAVTMVALAGAAGWASAQVSRAARPFSAPMVLSGENFGFRVEGQKGEQLIGRLVVRVNGKWVDAQFQGGVVQTETR